jgi:hypothetical protein
MVGKLDGEAVSGDVAVMAIETGQYIQYIVGLELR